MSNLRKHAENELKACGYKLDGSDEPYNKLAADSILELIDLFSKQGHSGFSASYVIGAFTKLAAFEPMGPLTGDDEEWHECGEGVFQNRRCGHVFKQADRFEGQAYDIEGRIFRDPDGSCFTGHGSAVPITFPYTPAREYVDAPERAK